MGLLIECAAEATAENEQLLVELASPPPTLGHALVWRTDTAAGLRLGKSSTEMVIQTERPRLKANLTVRSIDEATEAMVRAGGKG